MEALMREQVQAQLARAREAARARELEEARQTIERLLEAERAQNERLVNLQREKDQLTHLLVHDLRSPLTGLWDVTFALRVPLAAADRPHRRGRDAPSDTSPSRIARAKPALDRPQLQLYSLPQ